MRLAVYGPISARGGSTATAFFHLVEAWLRAGHEIDLFSPGTWIDPAHLLGTSGFRYVAVDLAPAKRLVNMTPHRLPYALHRAVEFGLSEAQRALHEREVSSAILRAHAARPYTALVVLNTLSTLDISRDLPVVSFPQGPPAGESDFVRREPGLVRKECGWVAWALIRGGYAVRDPAVMRSLRHSDLIVTSSAWTRDMFVRKGVAADRTAILCPPVDLSRFVLTPRPAKDGDIRFLWLGRIVPRKRLPLALAATDILRKRGRGARMIVIGGPGYGRLVREYRLPPFGVGAERASGVPHDEVPRLMGQTDVILQPSENENFGGAVAEGLACGVPAVLGPTNGTADVMAEAAFRFDRYEPESVADAMERAMDAVLADPRGIAERARKIAEKSLDVEAIAVRATALIAGAAERWRARL
jgi:glycosyltransferase involved in cell wall biosynthesis